MDNFEDLSFRLSFFNSIFELLAGYNFAFAGLQIVNHFVNSHLILTARRQYRSSKLTRDATSFSSLTAEAFVVTPEAQEKINSLITRLKEINENYKRFYNTKFLKVKARIKFIPIFIYCGFYCFYILILSGLAETQRAISLNSNAINISGFYSLRNCSFIILFFFNLFSFAYLIIVLLRDWRKRSRYNRAVFISARLLFVRATQFFSLSLLISIGVCLFFKIYIFDSILFELSTFLFSIILSLSPILSLTFWAYAGHRIKFSVNDDVQMAIFQEIHHTASPFARSKFSDFPDFTYYLKASENDNLLKLLYIKGFFKIYWLKLGAILICLTILIGSIYNLVTPKDKEIIQFIELSVNSEYRAYKLLPQLDTAWLDKYYTKDGEGRKKIIERLLYHYNRNEIINNYKNPSGFEFIKGSIIHLNDKRILVETNEYWSNRWYNTKRKKYTYEYTDLAKETQIYILKRENGKWLIDKNNFLGKIQYLN
ncbi:hypothetical protein [Fibrella forsythiae]|uniref:Uncharacterized protein n=1 Tax=Fibrella forsythiae TaxID=2817061 RepID=A0ABS3JGT0_9BACT|nr:hypothetical protein [Fibrella forsythiae]MBO0949207.1 hypothetical protein [Fibrella forsythiae]